MKDWKKVNGVEGLYQNQNGNYYLRVSKPSKTFRSLNTKQIRVAKTKAKELVLGDQEIGQSTSPGPANFTLKELVRLFLKEELMQDTCRVSKPTKVRIRQALSVIKRNTELWNCEVGNLNGKKIHRGVDQLLKLSNASKNYSVYALKKVLEFGEDRQWVDTSRMGSIKSFKVTPRRIELPNKDQFTQIVNLLEFPNGSETKTSRAEVAFTFQFLSFTGMRLGEARNLLWNDVEEDRIIVRGTKSQSAYRFIPIHHRLATLIRQIKKHRALVFPHESVLVCKRIDKAIKKACILLNTPYLRHHDLRHYFATKAVQSGVDMPTIAKWLGHADGGVLAMKVYSNIIDQHSLQASEKLNF
jgi:integrase